MRRDERERIMATWDDLSEEALRAAKALLAEDCYRGCVNRSYYCVYCATASRLVSKSVEFRHGWKNSAHEQLPGLIRGRFGDMSKVNRLKLVNVLRRLRLARIDADYRPRITVNENLAKNALRDASSFLRIIGRQS